MLVKFSVQNHRAIRERQTFSMVADDIKERLEPPYHVARTGFKAAPFVLRDACLFGGNGSGKTSFVNAIEFMSNLVRISSYREAEDIIPTRCFTFHSEWEKKPSEFEITFIHKSTLYQYGFSVTRHRVLEEWLFSRDKSSGRWRRLFTREYKSSQKKYCWFVSPRYVKGERNSWSLNTRKNALFLSTAIQLNAKGDIKSAYDWIVKNLHTLSMLEDNDPIFRYTVDRFSENSWKKKTLNFLQEVDINLSDLMVEAKDIDINDESVISEVPEIMRKVLKGSGDIKGKSIRVRFFRKNNRNRLIPLAIMQESSGTRDLFTLSGPIIDTLERGNTIVIDELNLGLHPIALQSLIALFCDPAINTKNAQIIFTTHDASIVENTYSECDQVWLMDKDNRSLAAQLTSLTQFEDSTTKNFSKDYLRGRYGGVPNPWRRI